MFFFKVANSIWRKVSVVNYQLFCFEMEKKMVALFVILYTNPMLLWSWISNKYLDVIHSLPERSAVNFSKYSDSDSQRFVSSTENMEVLLSHTHSIVFLSQFDPIFFFIKKNISADDTIFLIFFLNIVESAELNSCMIFFWLKIGWGTYNLTCRRSSMFSVPDTNLWYSLFTFCNKNNSKES